MSDNAWKYLVHQTKLDEQYENLDQQDNMTSREKAMALARFAEANVYGPLIREMEKLEKKMAYLKEELDATKSAP